MTNENETILIVAGGEKLLFFNEVRRKRFSFVEFSFFRVEKRTNFTRRDEIGRSIFSRTETNERKVKKREKNENSSFFFRVYRRSTFYF